MTNVAAGDPKSPAPQLFIPAGWKGEGQPPLYTAAQVAALKTGNHEELAHELFAAAQLAPGEGIEDAVSRIAAALTAPPAQPAAPQGVAYADLDDAFESWLEDQDVDRLSDGYESWLDSVRSCWDAALRASHGKAPAAQEHPWGCRANAFGACSCGQAPAGAALFDEQGFRDWVLRNLPDETIIGNGAWWAEHLTAWAKRFIKATPTAQAAPAADYDHGPQSVTVAEAARHVGKWLNERPNRPLDLRDVAMLCAHAQKAPAAGAVDGMPPGISALMCVISSLRDTAHFSDEEGELTDELRTLRDWAMTQATAPTPAAQADSVLEDAARWQFVELAPSAITLRLHNLRPDQREQYVDAARKQGAKHDNH